MLEIRGTIHRGSMNNIINSYSNNIVLPKESVLMRENDESVNGVKDATTGKLMPSRSSKMASGSNNVKSASDFKMPSFDSKFNDEDVDFTCFNFSEISGISK